MKEGNLMHENEEYLNTTQAAEYLHLSDRTIRTLCTERKIRHQRVNGRNIRFKKEWLDEYLESIVVTVEPLKEDN